MAAKTKKKAAKKKAAKKRAAKKKGVAKKAVAKKAARSKRPGQGDKDLLESVADAGEKIWFAGLGALGTAQEEGGKFFQNLVRKGRQVEKKARPAVDEFAHSVGDWFDKARRKVGEVTHLMPSKSAKPTPVSKARAAVEKEMKTLQARLKVLSKEIEKLEPAKPKKKKAKRKATKRKAAGKKSAKRARKKPAARSAKKPARKKAARRPQKKAAAKR